MTGPSAYPLAWPAGIPRTRIRKVARFSQSAGDGRGGMKQATLATARERLQEQLDGLGVKVADSAVLSTNVALTLSGAPRAGLPEPMDPGAVVYFTLKGKAIALPCDRWNRVADNVVALAKHIEAMRGMDRWGVGSIEQAFAGYAALPAPDAKRPWWHVLVLAEDATLDEIQARYRSMAKERAGDDAGLLELNLARDEAVAAKQGERS